MNKLSLLFLLTVQFAVAQTMHLYDPGSNSVLYVTAISSGTPVQLTFSSAHGLADDDYIACYGFSGLPQAVGTIKVKSHPSGTTITLKDTSDVDIAGTGSSNLDFDTRTAGSQLGVCAKLGSYTPNGAGWIPLSGPANIRVKDPDGAGGGSIAPVATEDAAGWNYLTGLANSWSTVGCDGVTAGLCTTEELMVQAGTYLGGQTNQGWSVYVLSLAWYGDMSKTRWLNAAKYLLNNMHRSCPSYKLFSMCDQNASGCGAPSALQDYVNFFVSAWGQAYSLLNSQGQLTTNEKNAYAQKVLNDETTPSVVNNLTLAGQIRATAGSTAWVGDTGEFTNVSVGDKVYVRQHTRQYRISDSTLTSIVVSGTTATINVGGSHTLPPVAGNVLISGSSVTNLDKWYPVVTSAAGAFTVTVASVAAGTYTTPGMYVRYSASSNPFGVYTTVVTKTDNEHITVSASTGTVTYTNAPWGKIQDWTSATYGLVWMGQSHPQVAPPPGARYVFPSTTITQNAASFVLSTNHYNNFRGLTPPFYITANSEIMKVTAMTDLTRTIAVDRGQFYTPAQQHTTAVLMTYNPAMPTIEYGGSSPTYAVGPYYANLIQRHTAGPLSAWVGLLPDYAQARTKFEFYFNWHTIWQRTRNSQTWAGGTPAGPGGPGYYFGTWTEMMAWQALLGKNAFSPSIDVLSGFPGVETAMLANIYMTRQETNTRHFSWADSGTARYFESDDFKGHEVGSYLFPTYGPYTLDWVRKRLASLHSETIAFRLAYGGYTIPADYATLPTKKIFRTSSTGDSNEFMIGGIGFRQSWTGTTGTAGWFNVAPGDDHTGSYPFPGMLVASKGEAEIFQGASAGGTLGDARSTHSVEIYLTNTALTTPSITDSGNVATITLGAAHGISTSQINLGVVRITGASDDDLNGMFYITAIPDATSLRIATVNVTDATYTSGVAVYKTSSSASGGLITGSTSTATNNGPAYLEKAKTGTDYIYGRFINKRYLATLTVTQAFRDTLYIDPGSGGQDYIITYDHNVTPAGRTKVLRIPFYRYTNTEGAALQSPAPTYTRTGDTVEFASNQYSKQAKVKVLYPTTATAIINDETANAFATRLVVSTQDTEARFLVVHQLCGSCTTATITKLTSSATHDVLQVDDGSQAWIAGFTQNPNSTATAIAYTALSYTGTRPHFMAGLQPNTTWDVIRDGVEIISDSIVDSEGLLRFEAAYGAGSFVLSNGGTVPLDITTTSVTGCAAGALYNVQLNAIGGTAPYAWTVSAGALPTGITLSGTGLLSGVCPSAATYNFTVRAQDAAAAADTQALSIVVTTPNNPSITTPSLANGTVNVAYSQSIFSTGGTTPYSYATTIGTLPTGLTLNSSTGAITGTPTVAGTYDFTITVTDSTSPTALTGTRGFTIIIDPPAAELSITSLSPLPTGTQNIPYVTALAAAGGTAPYTWAVQSGSFHTGLTLNSDGTLTGTPTTNGQLTVTVRATDAAMATFDKDFILIINEPVPIVVNPTATIIPIAFNTAYSQQFTCDGGQEPYTTGISGNLPTGMTFVGGLLSGTTINSSIGDFPIQITCTDANLATGTLDVIIAIVPVGNEVEILNATAVNDTVVFTMRQAGLDQAQTCAATIRDFGLGSLVSFGPQEIPAGPASRTVVLHPVPSTLQSELAISVACGTGGKSTNVAYSTVVGTGTLAFMGHHATAHNVLLEYGTTTVLGSSATATCNATACNVSVAGLAKGLWYIKQTYRDVSNVALSTGVVIPVLLH